MDRYIYLFTQVHTHSTYLYMDSMYVYLYMRRGVLCTSVRCTRIYCGICIHNMCTLKTLGYLFITMYMYIDIYILYVYIDIHTIYPYGIFALCVCTLCMCFVTCGMYRYVLCTVNYTLPVYMYICDVYHYGICALVYVQ